MKTFITRNDLLNELPKNMVIAELGVFEGEFSKHIFNICSPSRLYLIDLFSGIFGSGDKDGKNYHHVNLDEEMIKISDYFKNNPEVEVMKLSTVDFLNSIQDESLDMVYIDADHSYQSVLTDLNLSYNKVKLGGFICGHDYVNGTEAKFAVDKFCSEKNLFIEYITTDGCPSFCIIKKINK